MSVDRVTVLLLAPLAGALLGWLGYWARRARLRAAAAWAPGAGEPVDRGRFTPWLFAAAGVLGTIGLAGPRWGRTTAELEGRALNLVIGVDVSRSMLAEDAVPNRLRRAIAEARRVVQDARGDRIALLAFTSRSYIMAPLTLDDAAIALQLDGLDPEIASEGGTDLAAVLRQGAELLRAAAERGGRAMVLFTDGETHDTVAAALAAARAVREAGITLVLVGAGDTVPVRIPVRDERGALTGYQVHEGETVYTWRRDDVLRAVADAANGVLIAPASGDPAVAIRRILAGLERVASREIHREDLTPRGWLFGLGALLLLTAQTLLRRGPAVAGLLLALLSGPLLAQPPSRGDRMLTRQDTLRAAIEFAREAARSDHPDTAWFNAGTAALARARFAEARQWLGLASRSLDPGLRFRALYNLGLVAFHEARRDTARRSELHAEAASRFREALLLEPGSFDAKWNLELVQEREPPRSGGGSGGGGAPPTPEAGRPAGSALAQSDAEQLLNSVERAEREVRAEQARRRRLAQARAGRDW